jgi:predicted Zn-dependent protease
MYRQAGRQDQALTQAHRVLERWPDNPVGLQVLGTVLADAGRYDEAIKAHEEMVSVNPAWRGRLARTYVQAGREAEARAALAEVEAEPLSGWNAIMRASVHSALGDADEAFELLAYEPPHAWLPWTRNGLAFSGLREDPRYAALMERMNFPGPEAE